MSVSYMVLDVMPIFMNRPVEDSGWYDRRRGPGRQGRQHRRHARSFTNCRTPSRTSVPGLKSSSIDDKSGDGLRAHDVQPLDTVQRLFQRHGDEQLDSSAESPRHGV